MQHPNTLFDSAILIRHAMSRVGKFALGVATSAVGFYTLRSTIWQRAEKSVDGFRAIQAEIPGAQPVQPVKGPALPLDDSELVAAIKDSVSSVWNWGVVKAKDGAIKGVGTASALAGDAVAEASTLVADLKKDLLKR